MSFDVRARVLVKCEMVPIWWGACYVCVHCLRSAAVPPLRPGGLPGYGTAVLQALAERRSGAH